jgi:CIC family chloride channel protein
VMREGRPTALLPAADLARHLAEAAAQSEVDLLEFPAERLQLAPVALQATLQEALQAMDASGVDALYVTATMPADADVTRVYGVLRRTEIERSYRYS